MDLIKSILWLFSQNFVFIVGPVKIKIVLISCHFPYSQFGMECPLYEIGKNIYVRIFVVSKGGFLRGQFFCRPLYATATTTHLICVYLSVLNRCVCVYSCVHFPAKFRHTHTWQHVCRRVNRSIWKTKKCMQYACEKCAHHHHRLAPWLMVTHSFLVLYSIASVPPSPSIHPWRGGLS